MKNLTVVLSVTILIITYLGSSNANKYSKQSNEKFKEQHKPKQKSPKVENDSYEDKKTSLDEKQFVDDPNFDIRKIHKPFRMAKLNLLWTKAQLRLTEPKLVSLFSELKVHDKEEMTWKRLAAEGHDKDGLKEADLRRKLTTIMTNYGLLEHFEDMNDAKKWKPHEPMSGPVDAHLSKSLFKDKKLNKLWGKAEHSGFTAEELQMLKEEFKHHEEKVSQYYSILNDVQQGDPNTAANSIDDTLANLNEIEHKEEEDPVSKDYLSKVNQLRDKHMEIRDDFDRLYRKAMTGPNSQEFVEPKVQGLWKLAIEANFKPDELESVKVELQHYEKRLLKLRRLHIEVAKEEELRQARLNANKVPLEQIDANWADTLKKHTRKVAKMHLDLESRIMERHSEL